MKKLYYDQGHMWGVLLDESTGRHFIEVECGTSALYPVRILLMDEEVSAFFQDHNLLDDLAAKIASAPEEHLMERSGKE